MAIDPVERVREFEHQTALVLDLPQTLRRLAALPPSPEAPYLTVCLDWRPIGTRPGRIPPPEPKRSELRAHRDEEGTSRRPAREFLDKECDAALERFPEHGPARESLAADIERVKAYLDEQLDPAAHGVVIIACQHAGIFEPVALDVPVANEVVVGPIPSLRQLVHAAEDYPAYAVLVADQREAFLWEFERQVWERNVALEADGYPRHQKQGGWSQRRYQARADERVEHFASAVAEELRRALEDRQEAIEYVVIAADEPMYSALQAALHETVASRIIGRVHVPIDASIDQILAEVEPLVEHAERQEEQEAVRAVRGEAAAGDLGVVGPEATLLALQAAQVMTLVMNDDFRGQGWADYSLPLFGAGDIPAEHPAGGDVRNLVRTALEDECVRLAILQDAEVELVHTAVPIQPEELSDVPDAGQPKPRQEAARLLDEVGGIGALLRFRIGGGESTREG